MYLWHVGCLHENTPKDTKYQTQTHVLNVCIIKERKVLGVSGWELTRVQFYHRNEGFDAHVFRMRLALAIDRRLSGASFIQYNSAVDAVNLNVRVRYNFRERNDLWLIYSEGLNTDRYSLSPRSPLSAERHFLLKYTYTFAL